MKTLLNKSLDMKITLLAALCLVLAACGKAPQTAGPGLVAEAKAAEAPPADAKDADDDKDKEGVTLTPEQIEKLGLTSQPAQALQYRSESAGYGVVLDHQSIAQAVADLQAAQATAQFSQASLERARKLQGTPGAVSADLEQTAEQKAAVDSAALMLTTEKLSSIWGMKPPWKGNIHDPRVRALAHGDTQLVRVTLPLGSAPGTPDELHGGRLGTSRADATATLHPVWVAPADANIPGRTYFTLLPAGMASEGERLQVWAPSGAATPGALIPTAALVLSGGKFWCYVEKAAGTFVRVEVDTSRPTTGGYVVTEDLKPGDKVVITAAGQLLAKETGSSEEPD